MRAAHTSEKYFPGSGDRGNIVALANLSNFVALFVTVFVVMRVALLREYI